jgi:hypothetical protein
VLVREEMGFEDDQHSSGTASQLHRTGCSRSSRGNYGVKVSGCTVHFVDEGTDTGPIILQKVVPVQDDDTGETLADRILVEEHKALPEALKLWSEGRLQVTRSCSKNKLTEKFRSIILKSTLKMRCII